MQTDYIKPEDSFPKGKKEDWHSDAMAICSGKHPIEEEHIPALLCWLEDYNWPGAHEIADFLVNRGSSVVFHVKDILSKSSDTSWIYWILVGVVQQWPKDYVMQIKNELIKIAEGLDADEAHLLAFEITVKHGLIKRDRMTDLASEKIEKMPNQEDEINEILSSFK